MKKQTYSGFTLIEMIVVIGISSILFFVVNMMIVTIYQSNRVALQQAQYVDAARRGIETFVKDAREIDYAVTGAYPLVVMEPYRFSFYSDIDPDNLTELIVYELATSSLRRTVYSASGSPITYSSIPDTVDLLAINITNAAAGVPVFTYLDSESLPIIDPLLQMTDIRSVRILLSITVGETSTTSDFVLEGSATLRNLRDGV